METGQNLPPAGTSDPQTSKPVGNLSDSLLWISLLFWCVSFFVPAVRCSDWGVAPEELIAACEHYQTPAIMETLARSPITPPKALEILFEHAVEPSKIGGREECTRVGSSGEEPFCVSNSGPRE
jgi:hypothetical protein